MVKLTQKRQVNGLGWFHIKQKICHNQDFKLDISMPYYRVKQRFLKAMINMLSFVDKLIRWMICCILIVLYSCVINGESVDQFTPERGL